MFLKIGVCIICGFACGRQASKGLLIWVRGLTREPGQRHDSPNHINILIQRGRARKTGKNVPDWLIRCDEPHGSHRFYHININAEVVSEYDGWEGWCDPHIKLYFKGFGLNAIKIWLYLLKNSPWLTPVLALYVIRGVARDYCQGTTNCSTNVVLVLAMGFGAGQIGQVISKHIGKSYLPEIAAPIFSTLGGFLGGIIGSSLAALLG